ncbi:hypothetical protein WMY93_034131, partial [Mugilogobius chulae]
MKLTAAELTRANGLRGAANPPNPRPDLAEHHSRAPGSSPGFNSSLAARSLHFWGRKRSESSENSGG